MIATLQLFADSAESARLESATDIGILFASKDRTVEYVDLRPSVSRDEAVLIARKKLESTFPERVIADTTMRASVALYSGRDQLIDDQVSRTDVWAVVFDDLNYVTPGGPAESSLRPGDPQYNLIIDAHSGEILFSVVSGRLVPDEG